MSSMHIVSNNTSSTNAGNITFNITSPVIPATPSLLLKYTVVSCFALYIIFCVIIVHAIKKTKFIPKMSKFFAISLIHCYTLVAGFSILRRIVGFKNYEITIILSIFPAAFGITRFTIIAMLAIDRIIVILYPFTYCRLVSSSILRMKSAAIIFWSFIFLTYAITMSICNFYSLTNKKENLHCLKSKSPPFVGAILGSTFIIVCSSTVVIIKALHKQQKKEKSVKILARTYKTTLATLANIFNYIMYTIIYITAVVILDQTYIILIIFEVLGWCNAVIDAFIYALWFRECRLELLKMAAVIIPLFEGKVQKLRFELFDIQILQKTGLDKTEQNRK